MKYAWLQAFDKALVAIIKQLHEPSYHYVTIDEERRLISYIRDDYLFVVNLSPDTSYTDHDIPAFDGDYRVSLSSDDSTYGGQARIDTDIVYVAKGEKMKLYLPSRTAIVLSRITN